MARDPALSRRLQRRLALHQALHDPSREPRNRLAMLPPLRRWQARRLKASFERFLDDPEHAPAARFFLSDVYGDHDFSRRDADVARVLPMMQRLLPDPLLATVVDGIALGALSHAFDLRMAAALQADGQSMSQPIDVPRYASAYRRVGLPRLRARQIDLVREVGEGLAASLRMPGLRSLLRLSRMPAHAAGLAELQAFLERGVDAFTRLKRPGVFLEHIEECEREASRRLFAGEPRPFGAHLP